MLPLLSAMGTGGPPEITVWVGPVPEVGAIIMQRFQNGEATEFGHCRQTNPQAIEYAEAEAASKWPDAEAINGLIIRPERDLSAEIVD